MNAPDVVSQRKEWINKLPKLDKNKLVFLDESGVNTDMTRIYGRSLGGSRCVDKAPLIKPQSTVDKIADIVYEYFGKSIDPDKLRETFEYIFVIDEVKDFIKSADEKNKAVSSENNSAEVIEKEAC